MPPSRPKKVGIALLTVFLVACGAELYLRIFRPVYFLDPDAPVGEGVPLIHRRSSVPGLAYELRPGASTELDGVEVHVNSLGMRDDEPLPADTPGLYRIAVLGDSIGFGWKVRQEEDFSEVLQRELRERGCSGHSFDVLNFSVTGYSTQDEVAQFEGRVAALHPDMVVLAYCLNDPAAGQDQPLPRYFTKKPLLQRSQLVRFFVRMVFDWRLTHYGGPTRDYYRYLHCPEGPEWPGVVAAFDRLQRKTEEMGIPVVVVIFPWVREPSWEQYPYADLHEQVAAEARAHGFRALDLLPLFRRHPPYDVEFSPHDPHPTALGHRIAGEALADLLLGEDGLGGAPAEAAAADVRRASDATAGKGKDRR